MMIRILEAAILLSTYSVAQSATMVTLSANDGASSGDGSHFEGSSAGLFSDSFSYNPVNPTLTSPNTVLQRNSGTSWHELTFGEDLHLTVDLSHIIVAAERNFVLDVWGRTETSEDGAAFQQDDNFDVYLLANANTPNSGALASMTGLSINNAVNNGHHRVAFENLGVGTAIGAIRINFNDPGGLHIASVMELRAATLDSVPEPSSITLCALGSMALLLRRKK